MALFFDGFDIYTDITATAQGLNANYLWDGANLIAGQAGVFSYGYSVSTGSYGSNYMKKVFANILNTPGANWTTVYACFHLYTGGSVTGQISAGDYGFISLWDGATRQCVLGLTAAGKLAVYQGTTLKATGTTTLAINTWYWIAVKFVIDNTTGSCRVLLNDNQEFNATNIDTQGSANAYATEAQFRNCADFSAARFDNVHLYDGSSAAPFDAIMTKELRCYYSLPTGNGALTDWTPSAGSAYQCVDEIPPNTTDYISASTVGNQASFTKTALSNVANVYAVQAMLNAWKDDAATRGLKSFLRWSNGSLFYSGEFFMSASNSYYANQWFVDPNTAAAFVVADYDTYQFGVEVTT